MFGCDRFAGKSRSFISQLRAENRTKAEAPIFLDRLETLHHDALNRLILAASYSLPAKPDRIFCGDPGAERGDGENHGIPTA